VIGEAHVSPALLNPITWPEPFGLVTAEALATDTPVLTFPDGGLRRFPATCPWMVVTCAAMSTR